MSRRARECLQREKEVVADAIWTAMESQRKKNSKTQGSHNSKGGRESRKHEQKVST